ncbi:hypothetical protein [Endozoicomonas montiporae]|uniref:hypothetical protein n=1 Tax=Endozoicomonas montiporae TaxID=1027273 RepID=UPI0011A471B1|nr:hypothetical protein [Endozoicomonas montiporae]
MPTGSLNNSEETSIFLIQKNGLIDGLAGYNSGHSSTLLSTFIPSQEASFLQLGGNDYTRVIGLLNQHLDIPLNLETFIPNLRQDSQTPWSRQSQHSLLIIPSLNQLLPQNNAAASESSDTLVFDIYGTGLEDFNTDFCGDHAIELIGNNNYWYLMIRLSHITSTCLI